MRQFEDTPRKTPVNIDSARKRFDQQDPRPPSPSGDGGKSPKVSRRDVLAALGPFFKLNWSTDKAARKGGVQRPQLEHELRELAREKYNVARREAA